MANLNKVLLIGNLTRDPSVTYTPKGTAVTDIGIAVNRTWKDESGKKQEEVTFVDVTFFGRQAEVIDEHCSKGKSVYIEGRLKLETWQDKESGSTRSKIKVIGEHIQFLGSRSADDATPSRNQERPAEPDRQSYPRSGGHGQPYGKGGLDDDLPM